MISLGMKLAVLFVVLIVLFLCYGQAYAGPFRRSGGCADGSCAVPQSVSGASGESSGRQRFFRGRLFQRLRCR